MSITPAAVGVTEKLEEVVLARPVEPLLPFSAGLSLPSATIISATSVLSPTRPQLHERQPGTGQALCKPSTPPSQGFNGDQTTTVSSSSTSFPSASSMESWTDREERERVRLQE